MGQGTSLASNGPQTVNESDGLVQTINGVTYSIFNVPSYTFNDGEVLNINGDGSGNPVVFNFGFGSNVNLKGLVTLNGLTPDPVLWNFTSSGKTVNLNTDASVYSSGQFQGTILALSDTMQITNANLSGRFFGGDATDMQVGGGADGSSIASLSGSQVFSSTPEPSSIALLAAALAGLAAMRRRHPSPTGRSRTS